MSGMHQIDLFIAVKSISFPSFSSPTFNAYSPQRNQANRKISFTGAKAISHFPFPKFQL